VRLESPVARRRARIGGKPDLRDRWPIASTHFFAPHRIHFRGDATKK